MELDSFGKSPNSGVGTEVWVALVMVLGAEAPVEGFDSSIRGLLTKQGVATVRVVVGRGAWGW